MLGRAPLDPLSRLLRGSRIGGKTTGRHGAGAGALRAGSAAGSASPWPASISRSTGRAAHGVGRACCRTEKSATR